VLAEKYRRAATADHAPNLGPFAERNAGMMILFSLAPSGPDDGPFPAIRPDLSINARHYRFGFCANM
jgi:hypothetical protein